MKKKNIFKFIFAQKPCHIPHIYVNNIDDRKP